MKKLYYEFLYTVLFKFISILKIRLGMGMSVY